MVFHGQKKPVFEMKVGILTFHHGVNYGMFFQALGMVKAIQSLGHQAEIINYVSPDHLEKSKLKPFAYRRPLMLWHDWRWHKVMEQALARLPMSPLVHNPASVDWNGYDALVCGSDIIWCFDPDSWGCEPCYFGKLPVEYRGRLIAHAPSIGYMDPNAGVPEWMRESLGLFHTISVRDEKTQHFVRNVTGRTPPLVCDPTWLPVDFDDGETTRPRTERPYLLVYSYRLLGDKLEAVKRFAREQGLLTAAVGYYQPGLDVNWHGVGPFEWRNLIRSSQCFVTGTFHGSLFAIREHVQFCTLANRGIDSKVSTPLQVTGLKERVVDLSESLARVLQAPLDFDPVEQAWRNFGLDSLRRLKEAFE